MIALLCPSRGRPEQLKRMIDSAGDTSIFIGFSDEQRDLYKKPIEKDLVAVKFPDNLPTVHKWNMLAEVALKQSNAKLFMLASDDMIFVTPGWDKALIDHYNVLEKKEHVYALQDSRDPNGTPHVIVTREYIKAMGWFMPPYFLHWFIDSWTVKIANYSDCFTHLKDYLLIHDKPSDQGNADETHNRIRDWGWYERDKWVNDKISGTVLGMDCQRLRWKVEP